MLLHIIYTMATKTNFEMIKDTFNKHNCILISEYVNCNTKLKYICSCGNLHSKTLRQFNKNFRCRDCSLRNKYGYKLSEKYKSARKSYAKLVPRSIASQYSRIDKTYEALGYTDEEYYNHLMKFPEFYKEEWNIDHIFPIKAFTDHGLDTRKIPHIVNSLENLRPMCRENNQKKGCNYDPLEFMKFLNKMNCKPLANPYKIDLSLFGVNFIIAI